jgi:hypothetical protein|tara:strand:+ start:469 stop:744 length:276 start_codon:yes stop_codon:yes gene_type:complete
MMKTNEEETKEEQKADTKDPEATVSIVDEARAIRDEIKKEKESLKAENDRKQNLQAEELLSSSAGRRVEPEVKEETNQEYAKRILAGKFDE